MDEELVKRLRNRRICIQQSGSLDDFPLLKEAADAIEELSMRLHGDEAAIVGMKREIERMVVAGKPRWIPVAERLPDTMKDKSVYSGADVRPVVLCKDCKHKGWVQEPEHGKSVDYCHLIERCVDKQFFCAAGEKREER